MHTFIKWAVVVCTAFFLGACTAPPESESPSRLTKIAVNPWIGYTPFMYLERTGEMRKLGFKTVLVSSLGENANLMSNHLVDGFAATQYEYLNYRDELDGVVPVFTVDLSAGADKIHSNLSLEELHKWEGPVEVYLEFGSCNEDLFRSFVRLHGLEKKRFVYHHDPQSVIKNLRANPDMAVIVVSYEPFSSTLEAKGIGQVASTRDLDLPIVDALFCPEKRVLEEREKYKKLKEAFWRAKSVLDEDPRRFYRTVEDFLEGQSYENFLKSLDGIRWLPEPDEHVIETLRKQGIETRYLL